MTDLRDDLGVVGDLATALGLLDEGGSFEADFLSNPGDHLSTLLADDTQRQALVSFVDEVLGGAEAEAEGGTTWLPLVTTGSPPLTVAVTLDASPVDHIEIGIGVKVGNDADTAHVEATIPLFRAAKRNHSVANVLLLGDGGRLRLAVTLTLDHGTPTPGQAHLGGVDIAVDLPTGPNQPLPTLALTLRDLQLPGATAPTTLTVDAGADGAGLEQALLHLVVGLVQAEADALAGSAPELGALAGLLGLRSSDAVPPLPVDDLLARGVPALTAWVADVLGAAPARDAWLGHLAALVGGTVEPADGQVHLDVGPIDVALGLRVGPGVDGQLSVTPTLAARIGNGDVVASATADLCSVNLANGSVVTLPALTAAVHLGKRADGGAVLLAADPRVEGLRAGVSLGPDHRPTLLLAAEQVTIGTHTHAVIDLSSPDAVAAAGQTVLGDIADALLGSIGDVAGALLGLPSPRLPVGVTPIELPHLLQDPLGAVATYWRDLLHDHPAALVDLLTLVRDLLTDTTLLAMPVSAPTGGEPPTAANPFSVPLIGPVVLQVWVDGDAVSVAVGAKLRVDTLAGGCTVVESRLQVVVAEIDLAGPHARMLPAVQASLSASARGQRDSIIDVGPLRIHVDRVALVGSWRPDGGLKIAVEAPNLALETPAGVLPVPLPTIAPDGTVTLPPEAWDALERAVAALAVEAPVPWVVRLMAALGWRDGGLHVGAPHLTLADLADPTRAAGAIEAWLLTVLLDDDGLLVEVLSAIARLLTGTPASPGRLGGRGTPTDPWVLGLGTATGTPEVVAWLEPDGPPVEPTGVPERLRRWRPGDPALDPGTLAGALAAEAGVGADVAALVVERADVGTGLDALRERWVSTDGVVAPPPADLPGVTVHRHDDVTTGALGATVDLAGLVGALPPVVVHVALGAAAWPDAPAGRRVDLTTAGLPAEACPVPATPAAGDWFVALGDRAACAEAGGATDGTPEQAARLGRVLARLAPSGSALVVAHGGAGHAAFVAAQSAAGVSHLVTVGTAWSPIELGVLEAQPGADALRLLGALLPAVDPADPDDPDLATGRALVTGLLDRLGPIDPARDLRPPAVPTGTPRAGLAVHAVFGVLGADAVSRALTAVVAARTRLPGEGPQRPAPATRHRGPPRSAGSHRRQRRAVVGRRPCQRRPPGRRLGRWRGHRLLRPGAAYPPRVAATGRVAGGRARRPPRARAALVGGRGGGRPRGGPGPRQPRAARGPRLRHCPAALGGPPRRRRRPRRHHAQPARGAAAPVARPRGVAHRRGRAGRHRAARCARGAGGRDGDGHGARRRRPPPARRHGPHRGPSR